MSFSRIVNNLADKSGLKGNKIAEISGVTPTQFSRMRNGKVESDFIAILNVIKALDPKNEKDIMSANSKEFERPENIRYALEYLTLNRYIDEAEFLLTKLSDNCMRLSKRDKCEEWVSVYKLVIDRLKGNISTPEVRSRIRKLNVIQHEMKIMLEILNLYVAREQNNHELAFKDAELLMTDVDAIEDDFIRATYKTRISEILAGGFLFYKNDVENARKYALTIINQNISARFMSQAYYIMGMSFLFESYDESIKNFEKSVEALREGGFTELAQSQTNIIFASIVHGKEVDLSQSKDLSENAHYLAKCGKGEDAVQILDKLDGKESAFRLYYRGIATKNLNHLMTSYGMFVKQGNRFFAQLPKKELLNFGLTEEALNSFY